jgi:hypothetical protein
MKQNQGDCKTRRTDLSCTTPPCHLCGYRRARPRQSRAAAAFAQLPRLPPQVEIEFKPETSLTYDIFKR